MITTLSLENFRNYEKKDFSFSPNTTVIVGNNGVGKTNILEAISMLSMTTSWKTQKDTEVVQWGKPFTRIVSEEKELVIQMQPYLKRMRISGVSKRAHQVIGLFPTVLFQPDDILLLYGTPHHRRQYLDRVISQTSSVYTKSVLQLQNVLKQRNRLLKNIQEGNSLEDELPFWDQQLAELQVIIKEGRQQFIADLNEHIPGIYQELVPDLLPISLHYSFSPHTQEHSFLEHLQRNRPKEIAAGVSLYGPHREDVHIKWGEHLVEECLSRGQARSLLVAFKMAELAYISRHSEFQPVLLLDDIFSELDSERRQALFKVFGEYQVIMTTTEVSLAEKIIRPDTQIIELRD